MHHVHTLSPVYTPCGMSPTLAMHHNRHSAYHKSYARLRVSLYHGAKLKPPR